MTDQKRKPGRPKLPPAEKGESHSIRITGERWIKLRELGSGWLNAAIDSASANIQAKDA